MALTFDDGTADFSRSALPGLLDARLSATLYVTTAHIGGSGMLSWSEVVQAASQGVEVGAHSRHHPHLDTVSHSRMRREIVGSRADVEDRVGHACRSFAYPHGSYNRTVRQLVIDAGFSSAVAVRNAFSHEADDVFALARLTVRGNTGPERLADWLAGAGAPLVPQRELLRTTVYRQVRRARAMLHPVPEVVS
jgi:peptidoglycan/xylan/chitin deacetylase (PgdA/CDA1 family)